jgi:UDP-N-acetylglucosamine--N-acetylmuramyl-(pentapeptide) pyrophosphoryl-undecaprenol N-acetylglucosamine transferase
VILVPSPNVAEDHQTKNAEALSARKAAIIVHDSEAIKSLIDEAVTLVADAKRRSELAGNIKKMADRDSDIRIAEEILKLAGK